MTRLFAFLALTASPALADPAGQHLTEITLPHHDRATDLAIWYPNGGGGTVEPFAGNPVFQPVTVAQGAALAEGRFPLVVFSHGFGGTYRAQAWLGAALAERGAIVVSLDHPNTSWNTFDLSEGVKHWTRPQDVSVALDVVLGDPAFAEHIDTGRIMAAGFSYGGWTALTLGGMLGDHAGFVSFCEANATQACDAFLSPKGQAQALDPQTWNASYADPRITQVAAIDPGAVWGLTEQLVAALPEQLTLIGLGAGEDRLRDTDFDASGFADLVPQAKLHNLPGFHFTAMPLCTPAGPAILAEEPDDPICSDPEGTDRAAVHAEIVDILAADLGL